MWRKILTGLIFAGLFTVILAACTVRDASTLATGPTVEMGAAGFLQESITLKKGERLTLVNQTASAHVIANGTWEESSAKPGAESGAPSVNLNFTGKESKATPPFNTAGTFKLYCPIHGGMNLTVVVE